MGMNNKYDFPRRIVCLTEESVETLYLLGQQHRIVGVSAFVKRPPEAQNLPKVSFFTSSHYKKIADLRPDLILGHSDIQKDIARDLVEQGHNVFIANHRSIDGILQYIHMLSRLCGVEQKGWELIKCMEAKIGSIQELTKNLQVKPKVYFEEWDDPKISAIKWVSEALAICGADNIFSDRASGVLAKERFVNDEEVIGFSPDIIFACWCGKKVKINSILNRKGYESINAVKNGRVYELAPEIFLQPGPALILDGLDVLINYIVGDKK